MLIAEGLARDSDLEKEVVEERRVASWLPAVFPSSSKFSGQVHHVDWEGRLWVTSYPQGCRESSRLSVRLSTLHADTLPEEESLEWEEGEACVARFPLDGGWYRATVLASHSLPPSLHIRFVDYGTELTVRPDQLRRNTVFQELPALAFPVRLNVKPKSGKWEAKELNFIHETVVDKMATFEVLRPDREGWIVNMEIPDLGHRNFGDFLSQNGFCNEGEKVDPNKNCNCIEILRCRNVSTGLK